ncbi:MAG: GntR family transcriptional regulator [Desulfobacterales bacterium]
MTQAKIQDWIATGAFQPGQRLKEEEIARRLSISRPPVREAFKMLEALGLIVRKPRCGVFVTQVTEKDTWEIYTLKAVLYEMAAGLAVDVISKTQIEKLDEMVRQMEVSLLRKSPDIIGYQKVHQAYHRLILDVAGNGRLKTFATILHEQVRRLSYLTLQDRDHLSASLTYHKQIVQAFKDGDAAAAKRLMRTHVLEALKGLEEANAFNGEEAANAR